MKRVFLSLSFLLVFVLACFAGNITGSWRGIVKVSDSHLEITYKLKAEGEKLTGSVVSSYGELPILDGQIKGTNFTFKVDIGEQIIEQHGKFYGDSLVLTATFRGSDIQSTFNRVN